MHTMTKLEIYLKHTCISQRSFAKTVGTTPNNLNALVKGKSKPSIKLAYRIEEKTGGLVTLYDWIASEVYNIEHDRLKFV